jgi:hypothetical protein
MIQKKNIKKIKNILFKNKKNIFKKYFNSLLLDNLIH